MTHDKQPAFPVAVCSEAAVQNGEHPHPPTIAKRPAKLRYLRKLRQLRLPRRILYEFAMNRVR
jgi:hypothetical protein